MKNKAKLTIIITLAVIVVLFTYKLYSPYTIEEFNAVNLKNIKQIQENEADTYSFVVTGNIKNSISVYDKRILTRLRETSTPDFILSTGNNVVNSGEGKYRVLYRTLNKMNIPFITSVGENEIDNGGHKNFYKYFGPFYYSFELKNSYFIFLDTTGHTPDSWQQEWLETELEEARDYQNRFVIMNKSPLKIEDIEPEENSGYIQNSDSRNYYQNMFSQYNIDAVFSSNLQIFHREKVNGVNYIVSGGAGGELIVDNPDSFYHYLQVQVTPDNIKYNLNRLENDPGIISKIMVNIWVALQSFLYTNYLNILIITLILFMVGFIIYRELTREVNYYRNFQPGKIKSSRKLKIAMFTNNYFPLIGGVAVSISRLARGLKKLGHEVYIFAPEYPDSDYQDNPQKEKVIRCKTLFNTSKEGMPIPVTNIFNQKIKAKIEELDIDLIHCHHPFWLGSRGLKLARNSNLPAIFTYHTRLEKYSHYLPRLPFIKKLFENRVSHFMIKRFANKCNAIFAPTDSTREYLRKVGVRKPVKVLPTGVDLEQYRVPEKEISALKQKYIKNDEILLITVSRLSREKNLYFLLNGIKKVKENTSKKIKLLIIGEGPEREQLKRFISENNLADRVQLTGAVDCNKISKYYLMADIFVFASTTETQGLVILEAMAGKTPVVAVRSSGIDDFVRNQVNGFKTEEDINKWAEKVIKLIKNRDLREEYALNALNFARNHSLKKMAQEAEEVYLKLISDPYL
ncbi:MAG: glycosyltransferase [Bacillota bacterium]